MTMTMAEAFSHIDRLIQVPEHAREQAKAWLTESKAPPKYIQPSLPGEESEKLILGYSTLNTTLNIHIGSEGFLCAALVEDVGLGFSDQLNPSSESEAMEMARSLSGGNLPGAV
jgi:hypothetical protein